MMLYPRRNAATTVADSLRDLSELHTVYVLDGAWLVVGPTGIFVITEELDDLARGCERARGLATQVRLELSNELAWVPFVDAVCASTKPVTTGEHTSSVIPANLIEVTVGSGPQTVDAETLAHLRLLRYRLLD